MLPNSKILLPKRERKQNMPFLVTLVVCSIDYLTPNIISFLMWQLDIAETKDDSEPDEESPTSKASKQTAGHSRKTNAHRQAQPKHRQVVVEISPPKTPFRGPASKREYPFHFLQSNSYR
jgi:hypothetical protein